LDTRNIQLVIPGLRNEKSNRNSKEPQTS
jgi:hypothetical protein